MSLSRKESKIVKSFNKEDRNLFNIRLGRSFLVSLSYDFKDVVQDLYDCEIYNDIVYRYLIIIGKLNVNK